MGVGLLSSDRDAHSVLERGWRALLDTSLLAPCLCVLRLFARGPALCSTLTTAETGGQAAAAACTTGASKLCVAQRGA